MIPAAMGAVIVGTKPLFMTPYLEGRLVLAAGTAPPALYLLSKRGGTISRIDPFTGKTTILLSGLAKPQDIAVGTEGHRILVDLDTSRTLLVALLKGAGPPVSVPVGLNPGQILRSPEGQFYLTARAVHILYRLDPDRYHPVDWLAIGDVFPNMSVDKDRILWLPLYRSGQVMEVSGSPLQAIKTLIVPDCDHPVRVFPMPVGGFIAGCRNAVVKVDESGAIRRILVPDRSRRPLRDMLPLSDGKRLVLAFRHDRTLLLVRSSDLSTVQRIRLPYSPVRLYTFSGWPALYVVMNDPSHEETLLSAYPLLSPPSVPGRASVPKTPIPRKKT